MDAPAQTTAAHLSPPPIQIYPAAKAVGLKFKLSDYWLSNPYNESVSEAGQVQGRRWWSTWIGPFLSPFHQI